MKLPTKRRIHFHGAFKEKYGEGIEVGADSMYNLIHILFKGIYPELVKEESIDIIFENKQGIKTQLIDPEQELHEDQTDIHIMPNPDGAYTQIIIAIIVAIISIGVALMLAPKMENTSSSASGANWETPENVVGQGGVIPVLLGKRLVGSRVASYGIDSSLYKGRQT